MISVLKLDKSQRKELGKYLFDLSKIVFGSLVIKLFEPGSVVFSYGSVLTLLLGLTSSGLIVILGLHLIKD